MNVFWVRYTILIPKNLRDRGEFLKFISNCKYFSFLRIFLEICLMEQYFYSISVKQLNVSTYQPG